MYKTVRRVSQGAVVYQNVRGGPRAWRVGQRANGCQEGKYEEKHDAGVEVSRSRSYTYLIYLRDNGMLGFKSPRIT